MNLKLLAALACLIGTATPTVGADAPELFETLRPSIAFISSAEGFGSGVVISEDGLILTNLHVANTPLPLSVKLTVLENGARSERTFEGLRIHQAHPHDDLALLKIDAPDCKFLPAQLAKSPADSKAGDACFALGFPYLPGQTRSDLIITQGLINSISREIEGKTYLQIDAAIMPGNSGGALVNARGVVVGIPTLRYVGEEKIGLAIPVAGIRMKDFSAPGTRKDNVAEADRLERMANGYLASDIFSSGGDPASAVAALQLLRQALSEDPTNAHRSYMVSETYRLLGMLAPARAYAENAVRLAPENFAIRYALATICERLQDDEGALAAYLACIPLVSVTKNDFQRTEVFRKPLALLETRREALRTVYLISWSKAVFGGPLSLDEQFQIKQISDAIPEELVKSILAKTSDHTLEEMAKLAAEHPQLVPKSTAAIRPAADVSKIKEAVVANPVISSTVAIPAGATASLADAPAGVVYQPAENVIEWTPAPFSKAKEIRVLFLITRPDGTEETLIHTISREP